MKTKKRILLYDWGSLSQTDLQESLTYFDEEFEVFPCDLKWKNYDEDPEFEDSFVQILQKQRIQLCISFNFFPLIAAVCADNNILYVSWIYDCPHNTLFSETLGLNTNLIFTFDRLQMEKFQKRGVSQIFHLPLAVNISRLDAMRSQVTGDVLQQNFAAEISFVGSLYDHNFYQQIAYLPPRIKGYLDGLCQSQMCLYGMDLLEDALDDGILQQLQQYVKLKIDDKYSMTYRELFCDNFLRKNISFLERVGALKCLSEKYQTVLYSNSTWRGKDVIHRGIVNYRNQMPLVFMASALNLNCTIRSIQSGIPLRCLDIMGARGLLISNYQPELAEYFEEGEEWICFRDREELVDKTGFYLQRESLRKQIACRGYQKVKAEFTYQEALRKMFQVVNRYL